MWAVDVNERAVALCAENAVANGAERVHPWSSTTPAPGGRRPRRRGALPDVRFDGIWSNPPIRIGKAALHDLLTRWLDRLAPGGQGVARGADAPRRRLARRWLEGEGWATERLVSRAGYRLLEVSAR